MSKHGQVIICFFSAYFQFVKFMESGLIVKYTIYARCRKIYLYKPLVDFFKTPAICPKIAQTSVVLIVSNGVIDAVGAYAVTDFFLSLYLNQVPDMLDKVHDLNNTVVYLTPFLSIKNHTITG